MLEGRIPFGRFGHAMAKLGDINGDSFEGLLASSLLCIPVIVPQ